MPKNATYANENYIELAVTSNFSFLKGASAPEELIAKAAELGYASLALTDHNTLAGVVRAHAAAKEFGLRFLLGCRLILEDGLALLVYPRDRSAYGRLCRLLTKGNLRSTKGACQLSLEDFLEYAPGLIALVWPYPSNPEQAPAKLTLLRAHLNTLRGALDREALLSLCLARNYLNFGLEHTRQLVELAAEFELPLVATNDAWYHVPERKLVQDVLTCIRLKTTIPQAGTLLFQNGERYLKAPQELARLFRDLPQALRRQLEIAEAARFSLDELKYEYPDAICPANKEPLQYLSELTWAGVQQHYPAGLTPKVRQLIEDELTLIHELNYEKYFLTCYDIVRFARQRGILCQGRGAAANSAVCFCLGITSVDPERIDLLFARFISKERHEPPDIDIDFEHERREEVIQYIYEKYGRAYAGLTAEVVTYRHRSALREVAKALGLPLETADKLAKSVHRWVSHVLDAQDLARLGLAAEAPVVQNIFQIANELLSFPRHLSQHVGGFIICQKALNETVPILNSAMPGRTIIEWDKDDIETLGMLKIDILALGMLTCIRKALALVNARAERQMLPGLTLANIPAEDPKVYQLISSADTIGVFQIESRAQMSMLPRLKPRCFYDLVIEVAIVRPGPIQGKMVHPYLRRRNGSEAVHFPDERVRNILGKTLGVPLFQEQAMRLAIVLANFSPGEAEQLRRAMAAWKKNGSAIKRFRDRIVAGMLQNGYSEQFADHCVNQIKGFSEYGFPESHAASFALLVYASAWLKQHYPAEFTAALLNSQPMGFYSPAQIIQDLKNHGVNVLPIDVNFSRWETTTKSCEKAGTQIRLGFHLVKSLSEKQALLIEQLRDQFTSLNSIRELWLKGAALGLQPATLQILARANAFQSLNLEPRAALWEIKALPGSILPLDSLLTSHPNIPDTLPKQTRQQIMFQDYATTGFSLQGHPITFIRAELNKRGVVSAAALRANLKIFKNKLVSVAGVAIFMQRPSTAKGIVFVTIEDETGILNLIVFPDVFAKYQKTVLSCSAFLAHGHTEYVGNQPYIRVKEIYGIDDKLNNANGSKLPLRSYSY